MNKNKMIPTTYTNVSKGMTGSALRYNLDSTAV